MNPSIVIQCGRPESRERDTRTYTLSRPCAAARANHDSETPTRVAIPRHREPSRDRIRVGARAGALGHLEKPIVGLSLDTTNPARINSRESFTASRNRIPGSLSVQLRQKSRYVRCPFTHDESSFFASFDVPERSEGVFGNVRKSFGEVRNV